MVRDDALTQVNTDKLDHELKALMLKQIGYNLIDLFTEMEDLCHRIEAKNESEYDRDTYATMMFPKVNGYK